MGRLCRQSSMGHASAGVPARLLGPQTAARKAASQRTHPHLLWKRDTSCSSGSATAVLLVTASTTAKRALGGSAAATCATSSSGPLSGSRTASCTCAAPVCSATTCSMRLTEP